MEPGPGQGSHQISPLAMAHGPNPESGPVVDADADIVANTSDVAEKQAGPPASDTEALAPAAPEVGEQRAEAAGPTALPDEASQALAAVDEAVPTTEGEQVAGAELDNEANASTALLHDASQAPVAGDVESEQAPAARDEAVPVVEAERADHADLSNEAEDDGEIETPVQIEANKMIDATLDEAASQRSLSGEDALSESVLPDSAARGQADGQTCLKAVSHNEAAVLTNEVQSSVESPDGWGTEDTPPAKEEHENDSDGSAASVTSPLNFPDELATNPHECSAGVMNLAKCIEGADSAKPTQPSQPSQSRPADPPKIASGYPASAASYFGEYGAHRLRWAHAVNGRRRLRAALCTAANFLEADVTSGPLVYKDEVPVQGGQDGNALDTCVKTPAGQSVIMAHYPTELSSDLSFECFMQTVLRHNDRVRADAAAEITAVAAAAGQGHGHGQSSGSAPSAPSPKRKTSTSTEEEATIFTRELDSELEQASAQGGALASCVGSRRDTHQGRHFGPLLTLKGVKLDFKRFDCVAPCIEHLRSLDAARKLGGHLWLNADVFAGPGALLTPFDAKQFVRLCAENLPEAVLSLSWGSSMLSTMKSYSTEMVDHMIELCMTPIVPRQLPTSRVTNGAHEVLSETGDSTTAASDRDRESVAVCREVKAPSDGEMYYTPAAICRHITFAVAVEYAQLSADCLSKLLDSVPGTSLTLFSGYGSIGVSPLQVKELIHAYGHTRLFLDLKLSKAWRSCGVKGACSLQ